MGEATIKWAMQFAPYQRVLQQSNSAWYEQLHVVRGAGQPRKTHRTRAEKYGSVALGLTILEYCLLVADQQLVALSEAVGGLFFK